MERNPSRGYTTTRVNPTRIDEGQDKEAATPRQTQTTRGLRSMLSTESLGNAARGPGRSLKADSTDIMQKTIRMNPPRSCLRILSDAIGPPDGDTTHRGLSEREGEQCNDKTRRKVIYSRLFRLTGRGSQYTTASSFSSFISMTSPTSGFGTAWRPCNARSCPSISRSHPRKILARSRTVLGARRLRTKHAERIPRIRILRLPPWEVSEDAPGVPKTVSPQTE